MTEDILPVLRDHRNAAYLLLRKLIEPDRPFLLRSDIVETMQGFLESTEGRELVGTPLIRVLANAQEAVIQPPRVLVAVRPRVARWRYVEFDAETVLCRDVTVSDFLAAKERAVDGHHRRRWNLEVDLKPFERGFPRLTEPSSIGKGMEFLNRHLVGRLFQRDGTGLDLLFDFLRVHEVRGQTLMLNGAIQKRRDLVERLHEAMDGLDGNDDRSTWTDVAPTLRALGFEPGWGRSVRQIADTMVLLVDILEAPSPTNLERFLRRIPMIFNVAIVSPHGYFAQAGVLGRPDTGGQVVYILDQVRALEREIRRSIHNQGLDVEPSIVVLTRLLPEADGTTCDQPLEPILGTENARILRVPFRNAQGEVIPHWISRFDIWPHLERYAEECHGALLADMKGRPDLVIGNYSDGNLVATMLAHSLKVTQATIAHALEKTKYLHSDLYWKENDSEHHFAAQFTADLIAMNSADFIITSTYQEIAGTESTAGQYESYSAYTLPGLYRVVAGINPFDPKFNIVSPGADDQVFFPYWEKDRRSSEIRHELEEMIFGEARDDTHGSIHDRNRPLLMVMSRLDRIKNVTGFVEWYGQSGRLREQANLLIVGGFVDPAQSLDDDERKEIVRLHQLFEQHDLDGHVRWVEMQSDKNLVGELYRCVADHRGAFVQPALFEAFGLTVIEAMVSGLPVFATCYGGPLESVEHARSGFHIDPNHGDSSADLMAEFFEGCASDPAQWDAISRGAYDRVQERYTWKLHANRLLALARVYGFWKFITTIEREETTRYLELLYGLIFRPLAEKMEGADSN